MLTIQIMEKITKYVSFFERGKCSTNRKLNDPKKGLRIAKIKFLPNLSEEMVHGKSSIFYEKYCISHIPWHS